MWWHNDRTNWTTLMQQMWCVPGPWSSQWSPGDSHAHHSSRSNVLATHQSCIHLLINVVLSPPSLFLFSSPPFLSQAFIFISQLTCNVLCGSFWFNFLSIRWQHYWEMWTSPKVHILHELKETRLWTPTWHSRHIIWLFLKKTQRIQPKAGRKQGGEDTHISMSRNIRNKLFSFGVRPEM